MKKFLASFRRKTVVKDENVSSETKTAHVINTADSDEEFQQEAAALQKRIECTKNYPSSSTVLPSTANPFVINTYLKTPLSLTETSTSQCVIELRTAEASRDVERAPLELCLVLDRSGSMAGQKLTQAKEALNLVVKSSDPRDILHFVVYDTSAEVIFRDGKLAQQTSLCESIAGVQARGGTSLYSGLKAARDILQKSEQGYAKRIFLFSDGQDQGSPTGEALCAEVAVWLSQENINTSTFGIGTDFDEVIMKGISTAGGGGFVYMANSKEIPEKVAKALGALQALAAKDLNLKVEVSDGVTLTNTYSYSGFSQGVGLGTMSAPDRKQILLQLKIDPQACVEVKQNSDNNQINQASVAAPQQNESEEPVPPGADDGSVSEQKEEKKEEAKATEVAVTVETKDTKIVPIFKWTLTYVDIKTNTEQKKQGEAYATLTNNSQLLLNASEHPLVVVTAVIAESADKDATVLDLLNSGSEDDITRATSIKKQSIESLKAVEHLDDMQAITWLVKRMTATLKEMESRQDVQMMRQNVSYEHYQASSGLQCAGLI